MNLQIILSYSGISCQYIATAYPTDEAAIEFDASIYEAVDLESASVTSCLRTLLRRRTQAGDIVRIVSLSRQAWEEMVRWGLMDEWRKSLQSAGIRLELQQDIKAVADVIAMDGGGVSRILAAAA